MTAIDPIIGRSLIAGLDTDPIIEQHTHCADYLFISEVNDRLVVVELYTDACDIIYFNLMTESDDIAAAIPAIIQEFFQKTDGTQRKRTDEYMAAWAAYVEASGWF